MLLSATCMQPQSQSAALEHSITPPYLCGTRENTLPFLALSNASKLLLGSTFIFASLLALAQHCTRVACSVLTQPNFQSISSRNAPGNKFLVFSLLFSFGGFARTQRSLLVEKQTAHWTWWFPPSGQR
ncbi:hypothetical protein CEXT_552841 [Caerostris extrusa]|uniref:Uncharacterized protein n=1 Tax=Caerostris extrusa TaxID=172846 RepID=A0AAV4QDA6_CAEEX|nr:hypothetical protein CEXT_552841 [Caerostris extrusa]